MKINPQLFVCCFLLLFFLNSFISEPKPETCRAHIDRMNWVLKRTILNNSNEPPYKTCVDGFSNDGVSREEFMTNAYYNLMVYYNTYGRKDIANQYKKMVRQENIKR